MPLRDWTCLNCGLESEDIIVRSKEDEKCPGCGSDQLQMKLAAHGGYSIFHRTGDSAVKSGSGSFKKSGGK